MKFDPPVRGGNTKGNAVKTIKIKFGAAKAARSVPVLKRYYPESSVVAAVFSSLLWKYLTRSQMAQVITLNATETDPGICHSHDFCDANMVMDQAFRFAAGYSTTSTGGEDIGVMDDRCVEIWGEAWDLAIKANFAPTPADYRLLFRIEGTKTKRLFVMGVRHAQEVLKAHLPAVVIGVPVVQYKDGEIAAILKIS